MIKLKNIKIDNDFVSCDIYPEDSIANGYMKINIANGEVESYLLPEGYEYCDNHVEHARHFIINHLEDIQSVPIIEKTIMWY